MAKKSKEVTLQQIAEEMNDIMAYGRDPDSGEVDESEIIDVDAKDAALQKEILKRAEEDLRANDEQDFSPDVWKWFIDNGVVPAGAEQDEQEQEADEPPAKSKGKEKAAPAKDKKAKAKDTDDEDGDADEKKKTKRTPGGNEAKAIEILKDGGDLDDCIAAFTKIYKAAGNTDKEYILKRSKIYFNIACKSLGKKNPHSTGRKGNPEALAKAREARAAAKEEEEAKEAASAKKEAASSKKGNKK
jgi:hypothetical protein